MRQCPVAAWEGWTTRALRSDKISMGRRAFLDVPAAPLISGWMPAAPRNLGLALRALRDARGLHLLAEAHGDQLLEIDKAQSELDGTCVAPC